MKVIDVCDGPNKNWAEVELYSQEHGELPPSTVEACKPIDFEKAFKAAAKKCLKGKLDTTNAASLLEYAGALLNGYGIPNEKYEEVV